MRRGVGGEVGRGRSRTLRGLCGVEGGDIYINEVYGLVFGMGSADLRVLWGAKGGGGGLREKEVGEGVASSIRDEEFGDFGHLHPTLITTLEVLILASYRFNGITHFPRAGSKPSFNAPFGSSQFPSPYHNVPSPFHTT